MSDIRNRWLVDPLFRQLYAMIISVDVSPTGGDRKSWFLSNAPKTRHPLGKEIIDCRGIDLSGFRFGEEFLNDVLDDGFFCECVFEKTGFQSASAARCDFTSSHFVGAQMSPIYAPNAIFRNCSFERCFVQGWNMRGLKYSGGSTIEGSYSDLQGCDFTDARATRTDFDCCDFRGSLLLNAQFSACKFNISDFCSAKLDGAKFIGCDFSGAQLDDSVTNRRLVGRGGNVGIDNIEWVVPHT